MRWLVDWLFTYNTKERNMTYTQNKSKKNNWRIRIFVLYIYIYIFFYLDSSLSLLQFPISAMLLSKIKQIFFSFSSYFGNAIVTNQLQQIFFPLLFRQCHRHKFIPQNFFPFILAMPLPQINCHFFFFFLRNDMCTPFLQQILNERLLLVVIVELKK